VYRVQYSEVSLLLSGRDIFEPAMDDFQVEIQVSIFNFFHNAEFFKSKCFKFCLLFDFRVLEFVLRFLMS
jgi:hypothetical protein